MPAVPITVGGRSMTRSFAEFTHRYRWPLGAKTLLHAGQHALGRKIAPVGHLWPKVCQPVIPRGTLMSAPVAATVTVAPETLTITSLVAGGIIAELLILIVFLVRVAW